MTGLLLLALQQTPRLKNPFNTPSSVGYHRDLGSVQNRALPQRGSLQLRIQVVIASTCQALKLFATVARLRVAAAAAVLTATISLSSCAPPEAAQPLSATHIKIGTYMWPGSYWVDVAAEKGWFAEAGLSVERVNVNYKYFAAMDAVAAGELQALGFSQYDLVRHVAAGHDLVGVIAIDYSEGAEALIAAPGIRHLKDLHGKKVAVHRGTYLEYLLSVVAERDGLNLDEVTILDRASGAALEDFTAGRIDAMLGWEPDVSRAIAAGGVQLFSTADFPGLTYSVFTLRRDFIEAHPREVAALVRVWHRSERYVREHPEEACEISARFQNESVADLRNLMGSDRILDLADNARAFSYAAGFESLHGSWRRMNDFMMDRGLVDRRVDSPAYLNSRFIRALQ